MITFIFNVVTLIFCVLAEQESKKMCSKFANVTPTLKTIFNTFYDPENPNSFTKFIFSIYIYRISLFLFTIFCNFHITAFTRNNKQQIQVTKSFQTKSPTRRKTCFIFCDFSKKWFMPAEYFGQKQQRLPFSYKWLKNKHLCSLSIFTSSNSKSNIMSNIYTD